MVRSPAESMARLARSATKNLPRVWSKPVSRRRASNVETVGNLLAGRQHAINDSYYDSSSFMSTLFTLEGSVIPQVLGFVFFWALWDYAVYSFKLIHGLEKILHCQNFLSSLATMFMVFRLNGAHDRYTEGLQVVEQAIDSCRAIVSMAITYTDRDPKGPASSPEDIRGLVKLKTDIVRFTLVSMVMLKTHSRIAHCYSIQDFSPELVSLLRLDLMRCRGLLYDSEFAFLEQLSGIKELNASSAGCCPWPCNTSGTAKEEDCTLCTPAALPSWAISNLRWSIARAVVGGLSYGFPERCLSILEGRLRALQDSATCICMAAQIPVPLSYTQMAKIMLLLFNLAFPLDTHPEDGIFSNVFLPALVALIFHSLDLICAELEDPFGDEQCDLSLMTPLSDVEHELYRMLVEFKDPTAKQFCWRSVPNDDEWLLPRGVIEYLSLDSETDASQELESHIRGWS